MSEDYTLSKKCVTAPQKEENNLPLGTRVIKRDSGGHYREKETEDSSRKKFDIP